MPYGLGVRVPSWAIFIFLYIKMLYDQIFSEYKEAMKNKEQTKKDILNYVFAQMKNKQIELKLDLSDADVISIIKKEIKSREEAISFLEKQNKNDDVVLEKAKILVLKKYLPVVFDEEKTKEIVKNIITELWIVDISKERWKIMSKIKSDFATNIDMALVNKILSQMI